MTINNAYIQDYADKFTVKICDAYFSQRKYMTGPEMVQLTPSIQVNFFSIKSLFEAWQQELEKMKSNPYFDYRDNAVHEALREFMNILSRSIKVERKDFEPLLKNAVVESIQLALDPVAYFEKEFDKKDPSQLNAYLKENKKYFKWHTDLIQNIIDRAGLAHTREAFKQALNQNFERLSDQLEPAEKLLETLNAVYPLELPKLFENPSVNQAVEANTPTPEPPLTAEGPKAQTTSQAAEPEKKPEPETIKQSSSPSSLPSAINYKMAPMENALDPLQIWSKFEAEEYSIMKGTIKDLADSIGINQKFMFTKALFDGNPDLLSHALKSIDQCESFADAINLLNQRYVGELNWDKNSDEVNEFLQLIFRKFDHRN
ncbi:hypothetical protein [Cecembia calidifontis]|jgi:hypothetical protein|uniref:Uncharacterized protein n=1 Tax=Cecembia calidifontis TaxID=1187080 RepID=A0A4Q7P6W9_9BACT|nr:hypothetical protein [Cecembia calidifontis]RZS95764.1 hypothetical protein BC751_1305 [Cecembia calidifontis]